MEEAERLCDRVAIVDHGKLVRLGTPTELIASLPGNHVVEIETERGQLALDAGELRALPSVGEAHLSPEGAWSLAVSEPEHAVAEVLALIEGKRLRLVLICARILFSVEVRGSCLALFAVAIGGGASFAAIAIAVASRAQNTETASGLMNLIMMPMFIASGVFFSSSNFPDFLQPAIRVLPLTAMCDGMRAVMIDGAGLLGVLPSLLILALWGVPAFVLGLRYFRWN